MKKIIKLFVTISLIFSIFFASSIAIFAEDNQANGSWPVCNDIVAEAAILIDADTGAILYEKNADKKMYPASITKILTALIAIENSTLDEKVTFSKNAVSLDTDDANLGFSQGEEISMSDCIYGLLLASANECANAIAEHISGDSSSFASLMNEYASKCGAKNTHFSNPSGLFDENHYTTCYDMAQITRAAASNSTYLSIDGCTSHTIAPTNKCSTERTFYHRHKMLFPTNEVYYPDVIGGKTGYLDEAGRTLVTIAKRDNQRLISVVMKSTTESVYKDTATLLDYGFNNFYSLNIADNEDKFSTESSILSEGINLAKIDSNSSVTIPNTISFSDLSLEYITEENKDYFATLNYYYMGHYVGSAKLSIAKSTSTPDYSPLKPIENVSYDLSLENNFYINLRIIFLILIIIAVVLVIFIILRRFALDYSFKGINISGFEQRKKRRKDKKYRNKSRRKL